MIRRLLWTAVAAVVLLAAGCTPKVEKLPSEDIEVMQAFAQEIRVLKDRSLPRNAPQRFDAALRLAEGVDFSFTRNVSTLEKIFDPADARRLYLSTTEEVIIFSYYYNDKSINFNFSRTNNAVAHSNVVISDAGK